MARLPVANVLKRLVRDKADFVLIGVFAINHYAPDPSYAYLTQDCDILIRPDIATIRKAVRALQAEKYKLQAGGEPLPDPDDWMLARVLERRAMIRATKPGSMVIDIVLEAKGFRFPQWRKERRFFKVAGIKAPVASLSKLIKSKRLSGREKDKAFLKLYESAIKDWPVTNY